MDFTIEVERALRVLDGAVLLLCAVAGVQTQTRVVHRQMCRYNVPCVAFVNKCDRPGADPLGVVAQVRAQLGLEAAAVQVPLWEAGCFVGVIDLIDEVALRFEGDFGREVVRTPVPAAARDALEAGRTALLDALSLLDDDLAEDLIEERPVRREQLIAAIAAGVAERVFVPVLMGSAYRNQGVQPLLDAVVRYLPAPCALRNVVQSEGGEEVVLDGGESAPTVGFVFKTQETRHGTVSWVRLYQGTLRRGEKIMIARDRQVLRVGRLGRLFAEELEAMDAAASGDIVALFGAPCVSGDTLTDGVRLSVSGMHIPEPVVEAAVTLVAGSPERLSAGLRRFTREDPTLKVHTDPETQELRLRGMGELHLTIIGERLEDEYGCAVTLGAPQVAYRGTIARGVPFDHLLRRQTGGPGVYARVAGHIAPAVGEENTFTWSVVGGAIPSAYRDAVRRGVEQALAEGLGAPVVGVAVTISDGAVHSNDSSERAFTMAARQATIAAVEAAGLVTLEPVMRVSAEAGSTHQGALLRTILTRRGTIRDAVVQPRGATVEADVPLAEMFGYATALRSATGGEGGFSMSFSHYAPTSV